MFKYRIFAVATALLLTSSFVAHAGSTPTVSLFDGETLDGWTQKNGSATYEAVDGTILGTTKEGSPNSFLCTDKEYCDFILTFKVKVDNELNSGVQIRSNTMPPKKGEKYGRVNGPQVEIEASGEKGAEAGYIYAEACGGWMTSKDFLIPHKAFKDGKWNKYRIEARGANIQTWINGVPISNLIHETRYASHPKGFIGLQVHGIGKGKGPFQVAWKDIKIKELGSPCKVKVSCDLKKKECESKTACDAKKKECESKTACDAKKKECESKTACDVKKKECESKAACDVKK